MERTRVTHDPSKLRVTEQEVPHLAHAGSREEVRGLPADEAGGDSGDGGADDCTTGNWSDSVPLFVKMRVLVLTVIATTNRESQAEAVNARTEIGQLSADGVAPAASHRCWRSPVRALA